MFLESSTASPPGEPTTTILTLNGETSAGNSTVSARAARSANTIAPAAINPPHSTRHITRCPQRFRIGSLSFRRFIPQPP